MYAVCAPPRKYLRPAALVVLAAILSAAVALAAGPEIYPAPEQAAADVAAALKVAAVEHRRLIIDFGGNWCTDCRVLDVYFHDDVNKPLLDDYYVLVHVNVGLEHIDHNFDIAKKYGVSLQRGVPALAVMDQHGKLLYSQAAGEFNSMRHMQSAAVTQFLKQWKAAKPGGKTA